MISQEEINKQLESRHGKELQNKINQAHVAICGLGGLGSHVAMILARLGVGHLHLIDFDTVDVSNLHRQNYYMSQVGMPKTLACKQILEQINPYIEITTSTMKVDSKTIDSISESIICEAFDGAQTKAWFVNEMLENHPEKYIVASSGMVGMESANWIQTRKVGSHFIVCGDETSDLQDGLNLVASRVVVCAGHQAHAILKIIQGKKDHNETK